MGRREAARKVVPRMKPRNTKEVEKCLADKAWRKSVLYTIVDEGGNRLQYQQNVIQHDFDTHRHTLNVILKARQVGFSTENCIEILDEAFFTPNLTCGIIAHTKTDAIEIFATKIKLPYESLDPYLRSRNPPLEYDKTHIAFANGSSIRVAVNFQSATVHRLLITELGKMCAKYPARADMVITGTIPTVHPLEGGRLTVESTAEGPGGFFRDMCDKARFETLQSLRSGQPLGPLAYRFHFYPWWRKPENATNPLGIDITPEMAEYFDWCEHQTVEDGSDDRIKLSPEQRAWYVITRDGTLGLGKRRMKMEHPTTYDEAFESSVEGAVYGEELAQAYADGRIGRVPYEKSAPVYIACDLGYGDATVVWFIQLIGREIHIIDYYEQIGRGTAYHMAQIMNRGYVFDNNHRWCFMPYDIMSHEKGKGTVLKDEWTGLGAKIQVVDFPNRKAHGIDAVRSIFNLLHFDLAKCKAGLDRLGFYRYEWDEDTSSYSSNDPIHDVNSHAADALQTLALVWKYGKIGDRYLGNVRAAASLPPGELHSPDLFRRNRWRKGRK